jgi:carbon starvation protein
MYDKFGSAGAAAFVEGGANLISRGWGIPVSLAQTLLATMVVLFAGTTMDTGVRLQRYIIQEWSDIYNIPFLKNTIVATIVAVGSCLLLAFGAGGSSGSGGLVIWPLFGSTNQILAGLTLLVISVMLLRLERPVRYTLVPMIFVLAMSFWAGVIKLIDFYNAGNLLLVGIDFVVLVTSVLVMLEAASSLSRMRRKQSGTH